MWTKFVPEGMWPHSEGDCCVPGIPLFRPHRMFTLLKWWYPAHCACALDAIYIHFLNLGGGGGVFVCVWGGGGGGGFKVTMCPFTHSNQFFCFVIIIQCASTWTVFKEHIIQYFFKYGWCSSSSIDGLCRGSRTRHFWNGEGKWSVSNLEKKYHTLGQLSDKYLKLFLPCLSLVLE